MRVLRPLARRFGMWNRERKASYVRRQADRHGIRSVLFVGVGADRFGGYGGLLERRLSGDLHVVAACDVHPRDVEWPFVVCDGRRLPFRDEAVDLVFSNAVIEHVGDEDSQRSFAAEHARVGRHWLITTPNRWFPVESHSAVVLRHWGPGWRHRNGHLFTRLVSRRELQRMLPDCEIRGRYWSPTFLAWGQGRPHRHHA